MKARFDDRWDVWLFIANSSRSDLYCKCSETSKILNQDEYSTSSILKSYVTSEGTCWAHHCLQIFSLLLLECCFSNIHKSLIHVTWSALWQINLVIYTRMILLSCQSSLLGRQWWPCCHVICLLFNVENSSFLSYVVLRLFACVSKWGWKRIDGWIIRSFQPVTDRDGGSGISAVLEKPKLFVKYACQHRHSQRFQGSRHTVILLSACSRSRFKPGTTE